MSTEQLTIAYFGHGRNANIIPVEPDELHIQLYVGEFLDKEHQS